MSDRYIETEDGQLVECPDLMTWAKAFESKNRWHLRDKVGAAQVSTTFLGLDHRFGGGPPLVYETMIFGGPLDQEQWRYSTRDEAIAGHAAAIAKHGKVCK